jgi:sugar phosphate permease
MLLLLLILTRGLGQSALSVVSLTIVGKWFVRRLSIAMGIFSVLISISFAAAIVFTQNQVAALGWRPTWAGLGWLLLGAAALALLLVRRSPESVGLAPDTGVKAEEKAAEAQPTGFTLMGALRTPAFWVFAVGSGLYNLVIAGVLLFNQSILQQLGFDATVFRNAMAMFMITGLAGNMLAGWLAHKWSLGKLMSIAMLLMVIYLLLFPYLQTNAQALSHAGLLGFAGGVVAVLFFTAWGKVFGRPHLGKIQGAAQVFTVLASAIGPWFLAYVFDKSGSYEPAFYALAPAIAIVAIAGWFVRIPRPEDFASKS